MARIDDYNAAYDLAAEKLKKLNPDKVAQTSGAKHINNGFELDFLGQKVTVGLNPVTVTGPDGAVVPLTDQVLILHYLTQADGREPTYDWTAYREIPGADYYAPVFYKRATAPLLAGFGGNPGLLPELAAMYPTRPGVTGDESVVVQVFPKVSLMLIIWAGDDEFPAEANILMDKSIGNYLSAEDIAWLAGRTVYPLVGMARAQGEKK